MPPADAKAAIEAELGEGLTFIVSPPNSETRDLEWTCGIAYPPGSGDGRMFVYSARTGELRLAPAAAPAQPDTQHGLDVLAFMQFKAPCDRHA